MDNLLTLSILRLEEHRCMTDLKRRTEIKTKYGSDFL